MRSRHFFLFAVGLGLIAFACDDSSSDGAGPAVPDAGSIDGGPGTGSSGSVGDAAGTEDGGPSGGDGGGGAGGILSAETHSTCTLRANGKVACWGSNNEGQLGDGTRDPRLTFVEVANLPAVVEVGVSSDHACARKSDGTVLCWGEATEGKLGDGDADAGRLYSLTPVTVKGLADAVELGSGQHHTCARRSAGTVVCWGNNGFGTLGDGTNEDRAAPVEVPGLTDVVQLSASYFSCARHATGKVSCWGSPNEDGELGNGTTEPSRVPVEVVGLSDAVEISAGGYHVCARRANGTVVCWGSNNSGRLGIGNTDSSGGALKPGESVLGLTDAVQISAGHTSSCALRATGAVVCWGSNGYGQIGNGATDVDVGTPTAVTGLTDAVAITVGQWHACARRATGAVVCWGSNGSAQIGDGTKTERSVPTPVAGLP